MIARVATHCRTTNAQLPATANTTARVTEHHRRTPAREGTQSFNHSDHTPQRAKIHHPQAFRSIRYRSEWDYRANPSDPPTRRATEINAAANSYRNCRAPVRANPDHPGTTPALTNRCRSLPRYRAAVLVPFCSRILPHNAWRPRST